jgi:hypothetical protein
VGRPGKALWWMTHPDLPDEFEPYFLTNEIARKLKQDKCNVVSLHTIITHLGDVMLMPAKNRDRAG